MKMAKVVAVVAAFFLAVSLQANSCGPKGEGGFSCGSKSVNYKMMEALWALDLNEDQEGKLDTIIKNHRKAMIDLEGDMMEVSRLVGFGKEKFDRKEFVKTKEEPFGKMLKARADFFEKIHAVLTPDQRAQFASSVASCDSKKKSCSDKKGKR